MTKSDEIRAYTGICELFSSSLRCQVELISFSGELDNNSIKKVAKVVGGRGLFLSVGEFKFSEPEELPVLEEIKGHVGLLGVLMEGGFTIAELPDKYSEDRNILPEIQLSIGHPDRDPFKEEFLDDPFIVIKIKRKGSDFELEEPLIVRAKMKELRRKSVDRR